MNYRRKYKLIIKLTTNVGIMSHLSLIINFSGDNRWKNVDNYGDYENQVNYVT